MSCQHEIATTAGTSTASSGSKSNGQEDSVRGPLGLLATISPTEGTKHDSVDHLGTPRLVCDRCAHTLARHNYYPYGQEATGTQQDAERMKFAGHERDLNLGQPDTEDDLDYLHARHYAFHLARFMSVDPVGGDIGSSQSWNRYSYALGNPLRIVDPFGLSGEDVNGTTRGCDEDSAAGDKPCFQGEVTVTAASPTTEEFGIALAELAARAELGELWLHSTQIRRPAYMDDPHWIMLHGAGSAAPLAHAYEVLANLYVAVWSAGVPGPFTAAGTDGRVIGEHAAKRMLERQVTKDEVLTAIRTGTRYEDPKHQTFVWVARSEGRRIFVALGEKNGWKIGNVYVRSRSGIPARFVISPPP